MRSTNIGKHLQNRKDFLGFIKTRAKVYVWENENRCGNTGERFYSITHLITIGAVSMGGTWRHSLNSRASVQQNNHDNFVTN